jgi:hypothetical protein
MTFVVYVGYRLGDWRRFWGANSSGERYERGGGDCGEYEQMHGLVLYGMGYSNFRGKKERIRWIE